MRIHFSENNSVEFIAETLASLEIYMREQEERIATLRETGTMGVLDVCWEWDEQLCWRCGAAESDHYGLHGYCHPEEWDGEEYHRWDKGTFVGRPGPREDE